MENRAWEIIHCHLCFLFPPAFEARGAPKNHWKSARALLVALFVGCRLETLFLNNSALPEEGLLGLEVQPWAISLSYHQPKPWMKLGYFLVNTLQCRSRINKSNHWSNSEYKETLTAACINPAEESEDMASFSSLTMLYHSTGNSHFASQWIFTDLFQLSLIINNRYL